VRGFNPFKIWAQALSSKHHFSERNERRISMKKVQIKTALVVMGMLVIGSAYAHDPSEHTGKAEKPKCEAMENMDRSKMDMNDPVMQAMMKKCKAAHDDDGQGDQHQSSSDDKNAH